MLRTTDNNGTGTRGVLRGPRGPKKMIDASMHLLSNIFRCIVWFDIDWKIPENFSTKGVSWHGRRVSGISLGDLLMQILFTAHT